MKVLRIPNVGIGAIDVRKTFVGQVIAWSKCPSEPEVLLEQYKRDPENQQSLLQLMICYQRDPRRVQQLYTAAGQKISPLCRYAYALSMAKDGNNDCAEEELWKVLDEDPFFIEALVSLGTIYNRTNRYEEAQHVADYLLMIEATISEGWFIRSKSFARRDRWNDTVLSQTMAIRCVEDGMTLAILQVPKEEVLCGFYVSRAVAYGHINEPKKQIADLESAYHYGPKDPEVTRETILWHQENGTAQKFMQRLLMNRLKANMGSESWIEMAGMFFAKWKDKKRLADLLIAATKCKGTQAILGVLAQVQQNTDPLFCGEVFHLVSTTSPTAARAVMSAIELQSVR